MMSKLTLLIAGLLTLQTPPWKQATAGYTFAFPRDHASHPDYKIEWWSYTGNVKAADGRRFGYQVTFFRVGVDHTPVQSVSLGDPRSAHDPPGGERCVGPALSL